MKCAGCDTEMIAARTGRPATYCSNACRQRAYRARCHPFPIAMSQRHTWTAADGKRPVMLSGRPASTTNPATWTSFSNARRADAYGIMLGNGLGCYDLDHVTNDQARAFIATIPVPIIFAEWSQSGHGVHIFIEAPETAGWKRTIDGISVERYTRARFILTTGREFRNATEAANAA